MIHEAMAKHMTAAIGEIADDGVLITLPSGSEEILTERLPLRGRAVLERLVERGEDVVGVLDADR